MKTLSNVLLAAIVVCCLFGLQATTPKPDTADPKTIGDVAARVPGVIAALQSENYAEVAKQIRAGTLTGDAATGEALSSRNKAAIDAAYRPLDESLQATLGDGKYTDTLAADTYDAIAAALKKAGAN